MSTVFDFQNAAQLARLRNSLAAETKSAKFTLNVSDAACTPDGPFQWQLPISSRALSIGGLKRLLRFDTLNNVLVPIAPEARVDRPTGALVRRGDALGVMFVEPKPAGGTLNAPVVLQGASLYTATKYTRSHQYIPSIARIGSAIFVAYCGENGGTLGGPAENNGSFVVIARASSDAGPWTEVIQFAPVVPSNERVAAVQLYADPLDGRLHAIVTYAINGWNGYQAAYHIAIENPLAGGKYFVTTKPKFLCHGLFERPFRWNNQIIADLAHGIGANLTYGYGWDYTNTPAGTFPGAFTCKIGLGPTPYVERFLKQPASPYPSCTESQTVPKRDGSGWVSAFRTNAGDNNALYTASCDNLGNWTTPTKVPGISLSAISRAALRRLDSGRLLLVYNAAATRASMTAALFENDLTAAPVATLLLENPAYAVSYPEIEANGDTLYAVYDRGRGAQLDGSSNPVEDIRLAKFSEASMIAGGGYTPTLLTVA